MKPISLSIFESKSVLRAEEPIAVGTVDNGQDKNARETNDQSRQQPITKPKSMSRKRLHPVESPLPIDEKDKASNDRLTFSQYFQSQQVSKEPESENQNHSELEVAQNHEDKGAQRLGQLVLPGDPSITAAVELAAHPDGEFGQSKRAALQNLIATVQAKPEQTTDSSAAPTSKLSELASLEIVKPIEPLTIQAHRLKAQSAEHSQPDSQEVPLDLPATTRNLDETTENSELSGARIASILKMLLQEDPTDLPSLESNEMPMAEQGSRTEWPISIDPNLTRGSQVFGSELSRPGTRVDSTLISQIVTQISDQWSVGDLKIEQNSTREITIQIKPQELGAIKILVESIDDRIHARIETTESITSEVLNKEKGQLLLSLKERGLDVPELDITYRDPENKNSHRQYHQDSGQRFDSPSERQQNKNQPRFSSQDLETAKPSSIKRFVINVIA